MSRTHPTRDVDILDDAPPGRSSRTNHRTKQDRHDGGPPVRRVDSLERGYRTANHDGYPEDRVAPELPPRDNPDSTKKGQKSRVERDGGGRDRGHRFGTGHKTGNLLRKAWGNVRTDHPRSPDGGHQRSHELPPETLDIEGMEYRESSYIKDIEDLQFQLGQARSKIDAQRIDLEAKDENLNRQKRLNNTMQSSRDAEERLYGRQEQDATIRAEFEGLLYSAKVWASKFCKASEHEIIVTDAQRDNFEQIRRILPSLECIEDLTEILPPKNIRRRRHFIRGWVLLMVTESMIRCLPLPEAPYREDLGHDYWLPEKTRDSVRDLENTMIHVKSGGEAITSTAFHGWRSITMALLGQRYPPGQWPRETGASIQKHVETTLEVILPLMAQPHVDEMNHKQLQSIFISALELSQRMRQQRACWNIRFPIKTRGANESPPMFDEKIMTDADNLSEDDGINGSDNHRLTYVQIAMTPILLKSGNHDGLQYGPSTCVQKAEVSCADFRA